MFDPDEITPLLKEIDAAIDAARFEECPSPPDTQAYQALSNGWGIFVVSFTRATDGQRGCDGTAMKMPSIVRLRPEMAERALKLAKEQVCS